MAKAEWLACEDPDGMLKFLQKRGETRGRANRRRLRLVGCACARRVGLYLTKRGQRWVALGEQIADDLLTPAERKRVDAEPIGKLDGQRPNHWADCAAHFTTASTIMVAADGAASSAASAVGSAAWLPNKDYAAAAAARSAEYQAQAKLIRDIFGNPFRRIKFNPAWRTGTALSLARQMYDSRDFGAIPILADALQDAGCDSEDILNHCSDANVPHVRGCWVVDLVLGKE